MDDALVQRWRSGDTMARTAVRDAVRSLAERVLTHPGLRGALGPASTERLASGDARRRLTADVADEVLRRGAENSTQLTALALLVVGRHVVEAMQEGRPAGDEAHLPPQVAVTYALSPDAVAPRVKEAAERHLGRCGLCKEDLRIVRSVVRSQGAIDADAAPDRVASEVVNVAAPSADESDLADALETSLAATRDDAAAAPAARRPAPRKAPAARPACPRGRVLPGPDARPARRPGILAAWPLLAVAGLLAWYAVSRRGSGVSAPVEGLAALADLSPPAITSMDGLPSEVQVALGSLSAGDCHAAAGRFRSARNTHKDLADLYVYEGAAFVCARDGRRALQAFDALDELTATRGGAVAAPRQAAWYRAQAQLLEGDAEGALISLRDAEMFDSRHRDQAKALAGRLELFMEQ